MWFTLYAPRQEENSRISNIESVIYLYRLFAYANQRNWTKERSLFGYWKLARREKSGRMCVDGGRKWRWCRVRINWKWAVRADTTAPISSTTWRTRASPPCTPRCLLLSTSREPTLRLPYTSRTPVSFTRSSLLLIILLLFIFLITFFFYSSYLSCFSSYHSLFLSHFSFFFRISLSDFFLCVSS